MPYVIAGEETSAGIDPYDEHHGTAQAAVLIHGFLLGGDSRLASRRAPAESRRDLDLAYRLSTAKNCDRTATVQCPWCSSSISEATSTTGIRR